MSKVYPAYFKHRIKMLRELQNERNLTKPHYVILSEQIHSLLPPQGSQLRTIFYIATYQQSSSYSLCEQYLLRLLTETSK